MGHKYIIGLLLNQHMRHALFQMHHMHQKAFSKGKGLIKRIRFLNVLIRYCMKKVEQKRRGWTVSAF